MSLQDSLKFVFQRNNFLKFVIYAVLYAVVLIVLPFAGSDQLIRIGSIILACAMMGYSISVLESLVVEDTVAPDFQIRDLLRGACAFIASYVYWIAPLLVIFLSILVELSLGLIALVALVMILLSLVFFYAFQIGWLRYAIHGEARFMLYLPGNLKILLNNLQAAFRLFLRQLGLALIGFCVFLLVFAFAPIATDSYSLIYGLLLAAGIILENVLVFLLVVASMVPLAQFGNMIGLTGVVEDQPDHKEDQLIDFDRAFVR